MLIENVTFWSSVKYNGKVWIVTDSTKAPDRVSLASGGHRITVPFGTEVEIDSAINAD